MEPQHQAGAVLFFQLPMIPHEVPEALIRAVGVHEVKEIFQAGSGILHINDGNTLGALVDASPDPFIMPIVPCAELRGIRLLCVNQHGIIK